jgi:hypothetical protein
VHSGPHIRIYAHKKPALGKSLSHLTNIRRSGATCSGKTTLAKHLHNLLPNSFIIHQDVTVVPIPLQTPYSTPADPLAHAAGLCFGTLPSRPQPHTTSVTYFARALSPAFTFTHRYSPALSTILPSPLPFHRRTRRSPRPPCRSTQLSARTGTPRRRRSHGRACAPPCAPSSRPGAFRTTTRRMTTSTSSGLCRLAMGSLRDARQRSPRRRRRSRPLLARASFGDLWMAFCCTGTRYMHHGCHSLLFRVNDWVGRLPFFCAFGS